jgi:hypothetical protein
MYGSPPQYGSRGSGDSKSYSNKVYVENPKFKSVRTIHVGKDGSAWIENEDFRIKDAKQRKGIGTDVFSKQVEKSSKLGFTHISCHAARLNGRGESKFNGYYTWPRFGYDQNIEDLDDPASVTNKFPEAKTVLDVMATSEGREWWEKNGQDMFEAKFDLSPGSRSMKVLRAYLDAKKEKTNA